ncbi:MAG TPA: hypothetical protein VF546_02855 [Pyrinomonadaceae bacterium]|jgi:hypothetical protein
MADTTTEGTPKLDRKIEFIEHHIPALEDGDYLVTVTQNLSVADASSWSAGRRFTVAGTRFSLKPDEVYKVFPPAGSLGDHSNVLPHVVLSRSTLPWERESGAGQGVSWLALLLFEEGEKPDPQVTTLGELTKTPHTYAAKFPPDFRLESVQSEGDKVMVIDVKASVLQNTLPTGRDLYFLAHVRQATDEEGRPSGDELSVVICNRLPVNGGTSTVHLVSVEGRYKSAGGFDYQGAQGDDLVRLVSLKSWSFACLDEKQSFKGILTNINHAPGVLRLPANGSAQAEKYYARGFVPVAHTTRGGAQSVSFYHGPLAPGAHDSDVPLPARAGDSLLRFDPVVGMFDIAYAAAWELGRMLALQSKQFSVGLFNWKRAHAQRLKQAEQLLLHPHLPSPAQAADAGALPEALTSWLGDLSLLKGVPFNYLVPDERMLPRESIRFFQLDALWVECLLDGAFSVGRVVTSDHARDQAVDVPQAAAARPLVTGFLLRSDAVSGWPGLLADADAAGGRKLEGLRSDRLSPNVLLCLFAGEVTTLRLHLKPEDLHFGLDTPDHDYPAFHKKLRDNWGVEASAVITELPWRQRPARTLDIAALADLIQHAPSLPATTKDAHPVPAFTSAQFGLEMIEGVDMVIFNRRP